MFGYSVSSRSVMPPRVTVPVGYNTVWSAWFLSIFAHQVCAWPMKFTLGCFSRIL